MSMYFFLSVLPGRLPRLRSFIALHCIEMHGGHSKSKNPPKVPIQISISTRDGHAITAHALLSLKLCFYFGKAIFEEDNENVLM